MIVVCKHLVAEFQVVNLYMPHNGTIFVWTRGMPQLSISEKKVKKQKQQKKYAFHFLYSCSAYYLQH